MDKMKLFAVAGNPILHSKSPLLFNSLFHENKIDSSYSRILAESPEELILMYNEIGLYGINITSPFKESIIPFLYDIDETAKKTGSVNTVLIKDGKLIGLNTDSKGCLFAIKNHLNDIKGLNCTVLGAGGAARSAVCAMVVEGCKVTVINRTFEKAQHLAGEFCCKAKQIEDAGKILKYTDILISSVNSDNIESILKYLKTGTIILDAVYHNSKLKPLKNNNRFNYIPGEEWLLYQGVESFNIFTGFNARPGIVRNAIYTEKIFPLSDNIILIGFMGCGKSSVGKLLAEKLNFGFIDTDYMIEQEENMPVMDIFIIKGEEYFRQKETEILIKLLASKNCVISTGGGIVKNARNREILKKLGIIIWLYSSLDNCLQRIDIDTKPLLTGGNSKSIAQKLFLERLPDYCDFTDLIVSSTEETELIAEKIYKEYYTFRNS